MLLNKCTMQKFHRNTTAFCHIHDKAICRIMNENMKKTKGRKKFRFSASFTNSFPPIRQKNSTVKN